MSRAAFVIDFTFFLTVIQGSIGNNDDQNLLQRIRQHGNCAEWYAFVMVLMIVAELSGVSETYLYISGILFVIGRLAHPFGLKIDNAAHIMRYVGNGTNILAALNLLFWIGLSILN